MEEKNNTEKIVTALMVIMTLICVYLSGLLYFQIFSRLDEVQVDAIQVSVQNDEIMTDESQEEEDPYYPNVTCGIPPGEFETLQYRGATLSWEVGNPVPEERIEIFYRVVDSLTDDIRGDFAIGGENIMDVTYLTESSYYWGTLTGNVPNSVAAKMWPTNKIYLSPTLVDSNQPLNLNGYRNSPYGPHESFHATQAYDAGYFAMVLVHEYVHVVQQNFPEFEEEYAIEVGWIKEEFGFDRPAEDEHATFFNVLSSYSLYSHIEDMAETVMYSYLCGNNLERLSEERLRYIDEFWGTNNRQEYCQDFH
jgi:hypothetical protein